eukprot:1601699-Prymnesium_polylepis.2
MPRSRADVYCETKVVTPNARPRRSELSAASTAERVTLAAMMMSAAQERKGGETDASGPLPGSTSESDLESRLGGAVPDDTGAGELRCGEL